MSNAKTLPCCAKMAELKRRVAPEHISKKIFASPWLKSGNVGEPCGDETCETCCSPVAKMACVSSLGGSTGGSSTSKVPLASSGWCGGWTGCPSQWVVF